MSYSRTVIVSFSLEDILESEIRVYTRGSKYSSNVRGEETLLSDWLKIMSCYWIFWSVKWNFGSTTNNTDRGRDTETLSCACQYFAVNFMALTNFFDIPKAADHNSCHIVCFYTSLWF